MATRVSRRSISLLLSSLVLAAGLFMVGGGLLYGASSYHAFYQAISVGRFQLIAIDNGTYAFQKIGTDSYYVVDPRKFTPRINPSLLLLHLSITKLIYKDDPQSLAFNLNHVQTNVSSYDVEQFALADKRVWKQYTYTSSEYSQDADSAYIDRWPQGIAFSVAGFVAATVGSILLMLSMKPQKIERHLPGRLAVVPPAQSSFPGIMRESSHASPVDRRATSNVSPPAEAAFPLSEQTTQRQPAQAAGLHFSTQTGGQLQPDRIMSAARPGILYPEQTTRSLTPDSRSVAQAGTNQVDELPKVSRRRQFVSANPKSQAGEIISDIETMPTLPTTPRPLDPFNDRSS
ncbi:hypothetical protein [Dictyobacter kobayashii]|uniref:Uncharacterized protein n=1 Tax=Dictyobacter kobayashii TaxID=2014872 RepID=A0A402AC43_9CHLR|nr:hypothetical protein [Dictyobacter kobayashii]GCE16670.1 hypothetical protein KDK_04700 [Dictyobacter kobayashii]